MKKIFSLLILINFSFHISAQWTEIVEMAKENEPQEFYSYHENGNISFKVFGTINSETGDTILNGPFVSYYENQAIRAKGQFRDSELDGDFYHYSEQGNLVLVNNFTLGNLNSRKDYNDNGNIESAEYYKKDVPYKYEEFFKNGTLKNKTTSTGDKKDHMVGFFPSGKKRYEGNIKLDTNENYCEDGVWKTYFENGNLKEVGSYSLGKKTGVFKTYYENGKLEKIGSFSHDEEIGEWKSYYDNGKLREIGQNVKGEGRVGIWKSYNYEGILSQTINYKKTSSGGKLLEIKDYYTNGQLKLLYYLQNGILIKEIRKFYSNGKIKQVSTITDGIGETKKYYENGVLKSKGNLKMNNQKETGGWAFYDENGKLIKEVFYKDGKETSTINY